MEEPMMEEPWKNPLMEEPWNDLSGASDAYGRRSRSDRMLSFRTACHREAEATSPQLGALTIYSFYMRNLLGWLETSLAQITLNYLSIA